MTATSLQPLGLAQAVIISSIITFGAWLICRPGITAHPILDAYVL